MKLLFLLIPIILTACTDPHALPYVSADAPMWHMNPDMDNGTANALTTPPQVKP